MLGHSFDEIAVTDPTRFRQGQHALIDRLGSRDALPSVRAEWVKS